MNRGTRVQTPGGLGRVAYVRMSPPDYTSPAAISVVLDARRTDPSYTGTIYLAELVTVVDDD